MPSASGVSPPVGRSSSRRRASSTDAVGASATSAAVTPERHQGDAVAALVRVDQQAEQRPLHRRHAVGGAHRPDASTASTSRLPARASRTGSRRSAATMPAGDDGIGGPAGGGGAGGGDDGDARRRSRRCPVGDGAAPGAGHRRAAAGHGRGGGGPSGPQRGDRVGRRGRGVDAVAVGAAAAVRRPPSSGSSSVVHRRAARSRSRRRDRWCRRRTERIVQRVVEPLLVGAGWVERVAALAVGEHEGGDEADVVGGGVAPVPPSRRGRRRRGPARGRPADPRRRPPRTAS